MSSDTCRGGRLQRMLAVVIVLSVAGPAVVRAARPNVLLIVCDDLNDSVEGFGGHPQTRTPCLNRFAKTATRFQRAYSNAPICAPSRSSFLTGIFPGTSGNYNFHKWFEIPVLKNSKTVMTHFKGNGYHVAGTGKLMHHHRRGEFHEFGHPADYGPFAFDGKKRVAHPSVPEVLHELGTLDGSFAPLSDVPFGGTDGRGWVSGNWKNPNQVWRYAAADDRDRTPDEINAAWAAEFIRDYPRKNSKKPFFLGVGFIRPHTPMVAPQRFFDLFPLKSVKPAEFLVGNTHFAGAAPDGKGFRSFQLLKQGYGSAEAGLKAYTRAYLACVAAVDECVGQVLDALDDSQQADNTIVIVTSDHGFHLGEKEYVFKNSLWEESTRVPLVIRAPGLSRSGTDVGHPVSLIDLYPTLVDLCSLKGDTRRNDQGRPLDGHSLRPFIEDPESTTWDGPDGALTVVGGGWTPHSRHHWSYRTRRWRFIRYSNGQEELYDHDTDPGEGINLATSTAHDRIRKSLSDELGKVRGPVAPGAIPQPAAQRKWDWFAAVDQDKDGRATEAEWLAWSQAADRRNGKAFDAEQRKKVFSFFDTNKNGFLSRAELEAVSSK